MVDAIAPLKVCRCKEVVHQLLRINTVASGHDDESSRMLVIGLIPQVLHHRQLL